MIDNSKEYILCATVLRKEPKKIIGGPPYNPENNDILKIEIGYRHHDIWERFFDELKIPEYSGDQIQMVFIHLKEDSCLELKV